MAHPVLVAVLNTRENLKVITKFELLIAKSFS